MVLDVGIANIFRGRNAAENGEIPNMVYDTQVFSSYYGEKTVGFSRFFTAKSNDSQADFLIEIQRCGAIMPNDVCKMQSFVDSGISGTYKIVQVQHVTDEDGLLKTDLTLQRVNPIEGDADGTN